MGPFDGGDIWFSGGFFGTDVSLGLFERDLPALIACKLPPPVSKQSATDSPAAAHPHLINSDKELKITSKR